MLRIIAAVLAGLLTFFVVVTFLDIVGSIMYPLPEGLDVFDPAQRDALAAHMATQPVGAWLFPFSAELFGAFAGALVAAIIERRHALPLVITIVGLALVGSITNWVSFPHPLWYMVGQVLGYAGFGWLAWRGTRAPSDIPVDPDAPTIPISDAITERSRNEREDD